MGYQPDPRSLLSLDEAAKHSTLSLLQLTLAIGTGQVRCGVMARGWGGIALPDLPNKPTKWVCMPNAKSEDGVEYYHCMEENSGTTLSIPEFPLALFWYLDPAEAYNILMDESAKIGWLKPFEASAFDASNPALSHAPEFLVLLRERPLISAADLVFVKADLENWQPETEPKQITNLPSVKFHGNAERFAAGREPVLRVAIAVLAAYPNECRNNQGNVEATKLRELIEKPEFWPETRVPPLEIRPIEDLLRDCLKLTKKRGEKMASKKFSG